MNKKLMIQCSTAINKSHVRRELRNGIEHIIVSSATLPDDVVMNGGLYPADEIANSFPSLERTLAPIEHPVDSAGNFLSASDPDAIHNFYAGAYNENVERKNGRVTLDKVINVQEALKSERGKRLLDRINELETSSNPRPIHTSTGVFLEVEELKEVAVNAAGKTYRWIARNMVFDHDAILLDSIGAATPEQGVGMAVNSKGEKVQVERIVINASNPSKRLPLASSDRRWDSAQAIPRLREHVGAEDAPNAAYAKFFLWYDADNAENFGAYKLPFVDIIDGRPHAIPSALRNASARLSQTEGPSESERTSIQSVIDNYLERVTTNASFSEILQAIETTLESTAIEAEEILEVFDDKVIFRNDDKIFAVSYSMSENGVAAISGIPVVVDRNVTYTPKTNTKGEEMKEMIINALKEAGVPVADNMSDADILSAYSQLFTSNGDNQGADSEGKLAAVVANALAPVVTELEELKTAINSGKQAEVDRLAEIVGNSDKYPGIDAETAKSLPVEKLKDLAANCGSSFGVPITVNLGADKELAPVDMPE